MDDNKPTKTVIDEQNPDDYVVSINAYYFLKDIQERANILARKGVGVAGSSFFQIVARSFNSQIKIQRALEERRLGEDK